ncbi:hypothetical protein ABE501_18430 [Comamonas testosteroni]
MKLRVISVILATTLSAHASNDSFLSYLKSDKEPTIKDATWMGQSNLYVGVLDNGKNRDGFASYVCEAAKEHGASPKMVKVVDVAKVKATGKFIELGKAYCK